MLQLLVHITFCCFAVISAISRLGFPWQWMYSLCTFALSHSTWSEPTFSLWRERDTKISTESVIKTRTHNTLSIFNFLDFCLPLFLFLYCISISFWTHEDNVITKSEPNCNWGKGFITRQLIACRCTTCKHADTKLRSFILFIRNNNEIKQRIIL